MTGDDGYNSIGTRLLVHFLKNRYELKIAATKVQQSGVGGKMSLRGNIKWEEIHVEGVDGVCVHGTPTDAIEFAEGFFKEKFDLVISGINLGANIGASLVASGTFAAAFRALNAKLTSQALVMSWNVPIKYYLMDHHMGHDIVQHLDYPGKVALWLIEKIIANNFWGSELLNINFPKKKTKNIAFTKAYKDLRAFYKYPVDIDYKNKIFDYPNEIVNTKVPVEYDIGAIKRGYISISPLDPWMLNQKILAKMLSRSSKASRKITR